jgi:hypothetical protein
MALHRWSALEGLRRRLRRKPRRRSSSGWRCWAATSPRDGSPPGSRDQPLYEIQPYSY